MGVGSQCHTLATLPLGKSPITHCTGHWVGPRASLDRYCNKFQQHFKYTDYTTIADIASWMPLPVYLTVHISVIVISILNNHTLTFLTISESPINYCRYTKLFVFSNIHIVLVKRYVLKCLCSSQTCLLKKYELMLLNEQYSYDWKV